MSVATQQGMSVKKGMVHEPISVCGIGSVTGYGWGHELLVEGLLSGVSAARPAPGYSPYFEDDSAWVAPIADEGDPADGPTRYRRALRHTARDAIHNAADRVRGPAESWA